ncbi:RnfABCDGE type electron transport complex subunit C [Candidatus Acetothermia bacterium]|jgi:electron transport complex protein RnfC|nr:RnfABCDGE type electron transport complex subunit C [Candidatus Acetothermia bacterium]MCI2437075.1 RnfABCDGE type electron transport complex subunit C [Candidatus Acetothermia bacterium]
MAVLGSLKTFQGGHYFGLFEGTPRGRRLSNAPLPKRVTIFLRQGFSAEVAPLVQVGDRVKTGQVIGVNEPNPQRPSTPVHATISGRVTVIEKQPHPLDGQPTLAVTIESDGKDEWQFLQRPAPNYERLSAEELGKILYDAGVTSGGQAGFPTAFATAYGLPERMRYLLINAIETEPYFEATDQLLYEEFDKFINGIKILRQALGNVQVHIGLGYNKPRIYEELITRLEYYDWCTVHQLLPKYPQGEDAVLTRTLIDLLVPKGGYVTDIQCVVQDVQHCVAAYEAVVEGKPFVERVISVAGSAVKEPKNLRVRIGTPIAELLDNNICSKAARIVLGSVLHGRDQQNLDLPALKDTPAVVALKEAEAELMPVAGPGFDRDSFTGAYVSLPWLKIKRANTSLNGNERACVRCGYCLDVCPQNLFPAMLGEYCANHLVSDALNIDLMACIECGLCAYVCPSKIPLLEQIREGKRHALEEVST